MATPTEPIRRLRAEVYQAVPGTYTMGTYNCRYIAGTTTWSQHAWSNAEDIGVPTLALGDEVYRWLERNGERLGLRRIGWRRRWALWRVPGHFNHLHVEGAPKKRGTPPCAGLPPPPEEDDMLKRGDSGADVARYQDALRDIGHSPGDSDGQYGPATSAATAAAQAHIGFEINGDEARAAFMASVFARQINTVVPPPIIPHKHSQPDQTGEVIL